MFKTLCRDRRVWQFTLVAAAVLGIVVVGSFVISTENATPDPVPFDETTSAGLGGEDRQIILSQELTLPRAQVFYSQYKFVAGYRGVEHAVNDLQKPEHEQQFGYPIAVYVSDLAGTDVRVTDDGYLETASEPGWIDAEEAYFVAESEAHTSAGDTLVPFSSRSDAESFTEEFGGRVLDWDEIQEYELDIDGPAAVRNRVGDQRAAADERVEAIRPLAQRTGSTVVVGDDAPTIQSAIDAANANSTVVVPDGTYEETFVVDKPVTIRGDDATVQGDGNGSVIRIESDDVAVTGVNIEGVGNQTDAPDDAVDEDQWDENIQSGYGYGDAGIKAVEASRLYIADVSIETPANGILLRDTEGTVIEYVSVQGSDDWLDGFMGVMAMRSPVVVQHSTFDDGRDGIYLHRSHETVIRNNTFRGGRFGVHFMYTSDSLVANNYAREQTTAGITIMTDPARNAVVGNVIYNASSGILPSGSHQYIAKNILVDTGRGLSTAASQTVYEQNVIYGNDIGIRASSIHPNSRLLENDIVNNDLPAEAGTGPLRFWTHQGVGNYWEAAMGQPGGPPNSYSPTDPIESQYRRTDGTMTLAKSPAARVIEALRDTTPGMRDGAVIDTAPLAQPVHPEIIADLEETDMIENPTVMTAKLAAETDGSERPEFMTEQSPGETDD